MIDAEGCFERGLLRKISPSRDLALKSLKHADFFLKEARDMIRIGKDEMAVIALYNAFFHTARALLFRDGVKERSHFCLARYIEELYVSKKKLDSVFLDHLDVIRDLRHEAQYSLSKVVIKEDLAGSCRVCGEFIERVSELIKG